MTDIDKVSLLLSPTISINSTAGSSTKGISSRRKHRFDDRSQTRISLALLQNGTLESTGKARHLSPYSTSTSFDSHYNIFTDKTKKTVKWSRIGNLSNLLSSTDFLSKFGSPILLEISSLYMAIATENGYIIGFNYHQSIEFILTNSTNENDRDSGGDEGIITCMSFSSDSINLAAGHSNGKIVIWNISNSSSIVSANSSSPSNYQKPANIIPSITKDEEILFSKEGHLENSTINHIGFVNDHHSQLYSSDMSGIVCYHLGIKQVLKKHFVSKRILGKDNRNLTIKACAILPMGSAELITDQLGVLAVMTNKVLLIVSILSLNNPHSTKIITHYSVNTTKQKDTASAEILEGSLSWYPCMKSTKGSVIENPKLAYASDDTLTILEIENDLMPSNFLKVISELKDKDKAIPKLSTRKTVKWKNENPILRLKWISSKILCVFENDLVKTLCYDSKKGKLTLVGEDATINVINNSAIQVFQDKLMILGNTSQSQCDVILGSHINWADTLMNFLAKNEHLKALITAAQLYSSSYENNLQRDSYFTLVGLPINGEESKALVKPYLLDIMKNSIQFVYRSNNNENSGVNEYTDDNTIKEYLKVYFDIISDLSSSDTEILESIFEAVNDTTKYFESLEIYLLNGSITSLSPYVLKELVLHYVNSGAGDVLTEILCILNIQSLDIDLTIQLCRQYHLNDALVYIWNYLLQDYETPLLEFLEAIKSGNEQEDSPGSSTSDIFTYMSYILTGRQFPTDRFIDSKLEATARESITKHLFNAYDDQGSIFPNLTLLLKTNSFEMLSTLNEFFEDTSLNDDDGKLLNRQYIVEALLDIYEAYEFEFSDTDRCQLSIFIARNYPKYQQFIRLSESTLEGIMNNLCSNTNEEIITDCELALQSLIGEHDPEFDLLLIEKLKAAKFYDVLIGIFRAQGKHSKLLDTWIQKSVGDGDSKSDESLSKVLQDCFKGTKNSAIERSELNTIIKSKFNVLLHIDSIGLAKEIQKNHKALHLLILEELEEKLVTEYIESIISMVHVQDVDIELIYKYLEILLSEDSNSSVATNFTKHKVSHILKWLLNLEQIFKKYNSIENLTILKMQEKKFETALDLILDYSEDVLVLKEKNEVEKCLNLAIEICEKYDDEVDNQPNEEMESTYDGELYLNERMWLKLINYCIAGISERNRNETIYNQILQASFKKISSSSASRKGNRRERSLLAIFNKFLEMNGNETEIGEGGKRTIAAYLLTVRDILQEVFILFSYENEMLRICLQLLHTGISKSMKIIRSIKLSGYSVVGKLCSSCGKILWGDRDQISEDHWLAWEDLQHDVLHVNYQKKLSSDKYTHCGLIFFSCGHGYHKTCWEGIGSGSCPICSD